MGILKIIVIGCIALLVIILLIIKNQKDKSDFENYINNDYPKTKDKEGDMEIN